jgi:UDPglucose 6-dehydrogenase
MVNVVPDVPEIRVMPSAFDAAAGADVIVLATDWAQFLSLDLFGLRQRMRGDLFFDGRNDFDPEKVQRAGFRYLGIGRQSTVSSFGSAPPATSDSNQGVAAL